MKDLGGYLGIPVFLLVSTWGLLKTILDVIERLNKIRDFALGIPKDSRDVPPEIRRQIFYSDWVPLYVGLAIAVAIFAAVFFMIPAIFRDMHEHAKGEQADWAKALMARSFFGLSHIQLACYGLSMLAAFTCVAHLIAGGNDWILVTSR
jgi:hypothetical protein